MIEILHALFGELSVDFAVIGAQVEAAVDHLVRLGGDALELAIAHAVVTLLSLTFVNLIVE